MFHITWSYFLVNLAYTNQNTASNLHWSKKWCILLQQRIQPPHFKLRTIVLVQLSWRVASPLKMYTTQKIFDSYTLFTRYSGYVVKTQQVGLSVLGVWDLIPGPASQVHFLMLYRASLWWLGKFLWHSYLGATCVELPLAILAVIVVGPYCCFSSDGIDGINNIDCNKCLLIFTDVVCLTDPV